MPKFSIEGIEYNSEDLSERGIKELASLQYLDNEIKKLDSEISYYEFALSRYAIELKASVSDD